jgi:hypothetical protein
MIKFILIIVIFVIMLSMCSSPTPSYSPTASSKSYDSDRVWVQRLCDSLVVVSKEKGNVIICGPIDYEERLLRIIINTNEAEAIKFCGLISNMLRGKLSNRWGMGLYSVKTEMMLANCVI